MAGFHLNFLMVALYETRLSLVTLKFCDGGIVQRNIFQFLIVTMYEKRLILVLQGKLFCSCTKACSYSCIIQKIVSLAFPICIWSRACAYRSPLLKASLDALKTVVTVYYMKKVNVRSSPGMLNLPPKSCLCPCNHLAQSSLDILKLVAIRLS